MTSSQSHCLCGDASDAAQAVSVRNAKPYAVGPYDLRDFGFSYGFASSLWSRLVITCIVKLGFTLVSYLCI